MADSYFGLDINGPMDLLDDGLESEEDEETFDAFNNETFGEDALSGDWEQDHEKLAELTELNRQGIGKQKNGDILSDVSALFIDDDCVDFSNVDVFDSFLDNDSFFGDAIKPKSKPRPPPGFCDPPISNGHIGPPSNNLSNIKICTVEEIERNLLKPTPPNSLRLEDVERNLIQPKPQNNLINIRPSILPVQNVGPAPPITRPLPNQFLSNQFPPNVSQIPQPAQYQFPFPQPLMQQPSHVIIAGGGVIGLGRHLHPPPPPQVLLQQQQHLHLQQQQHRINQQLPHPHNHPIPHQSSPQHIMKQLIPQQLSNHHNTVRQRDRHMSNRHAPYSDDEYGGLMTNREKHWVASIQCLQLNSSNPMQDDYYYIMIQQRQSGNRKNLGLASIIANKDISNLVKPAYTPQQYENSLGKLQVVSVLAPRKVIDADIVEKIEANYVANSKKQVSLLSKQHLLEIEYMYTDILLAEEALSHLSTLSIDSSALLKKVVNRLIKGTNTLKQYLSIKKGKMLILRVLVHAEISGPLAHEVIRLLPIVAKNDDEQNFLRGLPAIRHYLMTTDLETLVELSNYSTTDLVFLFKNKFGISVISNMIERAESLISQNSQSVHAAQWLKFVADLAILMSNCQYKHSFTVQRPVIGISGPVLTKHLSRLKQSSNPHLAALQRALCTLNTLDKKL